MALQKLSKKNTDSRIVSKVLISSKRFIKKRVLEFETISVKITSNDHMKEDPDIHEIFRSINKNIAKLGHPEFFIIKDKKVQINPKYLCWFQARLGPHPFYCIVLN